MIPQEKLARKTEREQQRAEKRHQKEMDRAVKKVVLFSLKNKEQFSF